jgi:hypothetical protein
MSEEWNLGQAPRLVVQTDDKGKGRSFSALVLARVYAPCVWDAGTRERNKHRPVMMLLAAMPEEAGAVAANIREGRKMRFLGGSFSSKGETCEVLRSERFAVATQKTTEGGTLLLVRHPTLFSYSPGMIDELVRYVCLPPLARLRTEAGQFDLEATRGHLERHGFLPWTEEAFRAVNWGRFTGPARLAPGIDHALFPAFAAFLVAGLAQRVSYPILPEPLFWAQLTAAMLAKEYAMRETERHPASNPETRSYAEVDVVDCGFFPGAAVRATQGQIGELLAEETRHFLADRNTPSAILPNRY